MTIEIRSPYQAFIPRFKDVVSQALPVEATVLVVSKGDEELLQLNLAAAWHFPQRDDGAYAGYYPTNSATSIAHLENLRARGAQYIIFPEPALWWLEHYAEFRQHLERQYPIVVWEQTCVIFALHSPQSQPASTSGLSLPASQDFSTRISASRLLPRECTHEEILPLFDLDHYEAQAGSFPSADAALTHYFESGSAKGYSPNRLFDPAYYSSQYFGPATAGRNAFVDFVVHGCAEGRRASHVHERILHALTGPAKKTLFRGSWYGGSVLLCADGHSRKDVTRVLQIATALERDHDLHSMVLLWRRAGFSSEEFPHCHVAVLEDFELACQVFRPSAIRLLAKSFRTLRPAFAITTTPGIVGVLHSEGIRSLFLAGNDIGRHSQEDLHTAFAVALRTVFESSGDFHSAARQVGCFPAKVALREASTTFVPAYLTTLMELVARDIQLPPSAARIGELRSAKSTRKVFIPCSDWELSGVNSAVEAIGKELMSLGWDVEILFTGDVPTLPDAKNGNVHLPHIPYYRLKPRLPNVEGQWEALITHLETHAPCIMLMAYNFAANSIAPALTEKVGVVAWTQSDDKDYYEQSYRLGRYCNAVVCVSEHIKQSVGELNPVIGAKTQVIHNSSVWESEITPRTARRDNRMRLIYTGRLVQYQKRILDVIELATGLDSLDVPYTITLAGEFSAYERIESLFRAQARAHLADGRIILVGRLKRSQILDELSQNDFFLLLSDFEGLPLSLIEAMAQGCVPVVAAMNSGIPEAVTDRQNGYIVAGRDYGDWARSLVTWWRDPVNLYRMSQRAQQTFREQFTVEHIGRQFHELFMQIASDICSGTYTRPDCLNWGPGRSPAGDILPPPSMYNPKPLRSTR